MSETMKNAAGSVTLVRTIKVPIPRRRSTIYLRERNGFVASPLRARCTLACADMNPLDPSRPVADAHFDSALQRARAEFVEMPGLRLTAAQARRLWALDAAVCDAVLADLVEARFLVRTGKDLFVRAS